MSAPTLESAAALRAEGPLSIAAALAIVRDVANVLAAAHAKGLIHGSICPDNIVLDEAGAARLCKDTLAPRAASPEQQRGEPADARSDIYALGAAVAELLAGAEPVPEPLRRLLATMMADDPSARPQTMDEVLLGLEACELMTGIRALRPGQEAVAARSGRRFLYLVVVGLGLVVLGLALLAALGRTPPGAGQPPESHKPLLDKLAPAAPRAAPPAGR